jgi:hypothetical protein
MGQHAYDINFTLLLPSKYSPAPSPIHSPPRPQPPPAPAVSHNVFRRSGGDVRLEARVRGRRSAAPALARTPPRRALRPASCARRQLTAASLPPFSPSRRTQLSFLTSSSSTLEKRARFRARLCRAARACTSSLELDFGRGRAVPHRLSNSAAPQPPRQESSQEDAEAAAAMFLCKLGLRFVFLV